MSIVCTKISAAGNDFLCIDNRSENLPLEENQRTWVLPLCDRRLGLGADGVLVWESTPHADLRMRLFNADGSEAEMCGNGLRAICLFAALNGLKGPLYRIETLAGCYTALYQPTTEDKSPYKGLITTSMPIAENFIENIPLKTRTGQLRIGQYVHVGVPHLLFFFDEKTSYSLEAEGPFFRHHPQFAPEGVNVHFVTKHQSMWHYRSYERGVEAETGACGTGATAIAAYLLRHQMATLPLVLMPQSGSSLTIQAATFDHAADLELKGAAEALFTVAITPHNLCKIPCHAVQESIYSISA